MPETKPLLLLKRYRSILRGAVVVEIIAFFVTLIDPIIAANRIGMEALSAIGLFAPFISFALFITSIVNSGTLLNYSYEIGRFDKRRAHEFFSEGILLGAVSGVLLTIGLLLLKPAVFRLYSPTPSVADYLSAYYNIMVFFVMMMPVSYTLENTVIADGGERWTAALNLLQITGTIVLSYVLAGIWGIRGIAVAEVFCRAAYIGLLSLWLFGKKCTLRFIPVLTLRDFRLIVRRGFVRASTYGLSGCMTLYLNRFILLNYGMDTFDAWVVDQKLLGLLTLFLGLAVTLQPLLGTLQGENNTKSIRFLVHRSMADLAAAGILCSVLVLAFSSYALRFFGVSSGPVFEQGLTALRITCLTFIFAAQMILLFVYYFMMGKFVLAFTVCFLKDFLCPVGLVMTLKFLLGRNPTNIWIGVAASSVIAMGISFLILLVFYGKKLFPLLLSHDQDSRIHIHSFLINAQNAVLMSETAGELLKKEGYPLRIQRLAGACIEDLLNRIAEYNQAPEKPILAECILMTETDGVRIILRDSGKIFDITAESTKIESFQQYIVERLVHVADYNLYITTTGYNRNELFFSAHDVSGNAAS